MCVSVKVSYAQKSDSDRTSLYSTAVATHEAEDGYTGMENMLPPLSDNCDKLKIALEVN